MNKVNKVNLNKKRTGLLAYAKYFEIFENNYYITKYFR